MGTLARRLVASILLAIITSACGGASSTTAPDARIDVQIRIFDNAAMQIDDSTALSGVRVEIIDGIAAGLVAVESGRQYRFGLPPGNYRLRLTKVGYVSYETQVTAYRWNFNCFGCSDNIYYGFMSQPPLTLSGSVSYYPPGTTVEILSGPNAGKKTTTVASADGGKPRYQIDGLVPSPPFDIRFGSAAATRFTQSNHWLGFGNNPLSGVGLVHHAQLNQ